MEAGRLEVAFLDTFLASRRGEAGPEAVPAVLVRVESGRRPDSHVPPASAPQTIEDQQNRPTTASLIRCFTQSASADFRYQPELLQFKAFAVAAGGWLCLPLQHVVIAVRLWYNPLIMSR